MGAPAIPSLPPPQQGTSGPMGFPTGQPGFLAPPPPQPTPIVQPELAPPDPEAMSIDPLVLNRPVKIRINASDRMRTRDRLQQSVPFLAQFIMNGPFLQELAQSNMTIDFPEFFRMVWDATGIQQDYRIARPLTPEEQQKRSQPSPDAQAAMQQAQLEAKTRTDIMQMKIGSDQQIAQLQAMVKNKEISEESARHILQIFGQEAADKAKQPDPRQVQLDLQASAAQHQQNLQQQQQKHALDLQHAQQKAQIQAQQGQQTHALDIHQKAQQGHVDTAMKAKADMTKMVLDSMMAHQKLQNMKAEGEARAKAARMMPKKTPAK